MTNGSDRENINDPHIPDEKFRDPSIPLHERFEEVTRLLAESRDVVARLQLKLETANDHAISHEKELEGLITKRDHEIAKLKRSHERFLAYVVSVGISLQEIFLPEEIRGKEPVSTGLTSYEVKKRMNELVETLRKKYVL
jgi:hypothetical protein